MDIEIEAKFLDVDVPTLRAKLDAAGARQEHPEVLMKRKNFDYPDFALERRGGWIRVRQEAGRVTMSYKQLNDRTLHGTQEVNLIIDDFERGCSFLKAIGFEQKAYQETKREKWMLGDVEVTIDTWPWIPSFAELEGPHEESLQNAARVLGLDWSRALHGSVETAYQAYYDFTEREIDRWEEITFIPEPAWLLARKKT